MKLTLDTETRKLEVEEHGKATVLDLYSKQAFEILSREWVRVGWNEKYPYTFSWLGRPIIQLPEDMVRLQEVIYRLQPDVIVETGVAHGGSLVYSASLCKMIGKGRVIGVDIEIRPHNRKAIEAHELAPMITLLEGSSTAPEIVRQVRQAIAPGETVLVILDSNHSRQHVYDELQAYADLVTPNSYIVATDGVMFDVHDVPRGRREWISDNPITAAEDFVRAHPEFVIEQPKWVFNESQLDRNVTHWPRAWIRRVGGAAR